MLQGINEVRLLGVVTSSPFISQEKPLAVFALLTVVKEKSESRGDTRDIKSFHKIMTFDPEIIKSLKMNVNKGTKLYISGRLTSTANQISNPKQPYVLLKEFICISSNNSNENNVDA